MADATNILNEISGALDGFANQVVSQIPDDRPLNEIWGWNMPAMNRHDLADYITSPKALIQTIDPKIVSDDDLNRLSQFPRKFNFLRENVMQHLPGGNAFHIYIEFNSLVETLRTILKRYERQNERPFDVQELEDKKVLPAAQLRALRTIAGGIQRLGIESADLERQVAEIRTAHTVAEALPADIQSLEDARGRYNASKIELDSTVAAAKAKEEEISAVRSRLEEIRIEADDIILRAGTAHAASTTIALGKAFRDRASDLNISTIILGLILIVTLVIGGFITYMRVEFVHQLMMKPNINYNILWLNVTFTALSVSGPVWLAWLLTRQIGQRFRLAEDYGYKATVARAYEGYRREAGQIDEAFSKKLFSIALDRLGEAPLRLVEKDSPGSPMHEASRISRFMRGGRPTSAKAPDAPSAAEDED